MRYTIRNGVEHPFSGRISDNARFILPLLVVLAGVLFFVLGPHHSAKPGRPVTLGIYNVKTPDSNPSAAKPDSGGSGSGNSSSGTSPSLSLTSQSPVPSSGSTLGTGSTAVSPVTTGGMGGGGGGSTTPTTVSCINQLTQTATLCVFPYQTCTIPLTGITGYKTVDGTCITIN